MTFTRAALLLGIGLLVLGGSGEAWAGAKEKLYARALSLYQKQDYAKAAPLLERLLAVLRKEQAKQKRGSLAWHGMTVGQCDAMERLVVALWKTKQLRASCRARKLLEARRSSLPQNWTSWNVDPTLAQRLKASRKHLQTACAKVPAVVHFQLSPKAATIAVKQAAGGWKKLPGPKLSTTRLKVELKIEAAGFQSEKLRLTLEPWRTQTRKVVLKPALVVVVSRPITPRIVVVKAPKRRPTRRKIATAPRQKPRPAGPPLYKQWWFWTAIGVGLAGAVTTTALALTLQPKYTIRARDPNQPLNVW